MELAERRPGKVYAYVMILFSLLVLGWSVWAIYSAAGLYQNGKMESFYFYAVAGLIAIGLAMSSLVQLRKRLILLASLASNVITTIQCLGCGFKIMRKFGAGDYVYKEVGQCQQCSGKMTVSAIYNEEPKKS